MGLKCLFFLKNYFSFVSGVRGKFRFERLRNKLRSSTFDNCELTQSLLRALRAICNISSDDGEDLFADELLVYYEWIARYEVEEQANEKLAGKKTQGLLWMVSSTPKHKVPTSVYSPLQEFPFTVVVSENVFCQCMVALINIDCVFFLECFSS